MIYCTSCGKQLPDEAAFCTGCGTRLNNPKLNASFDPDSESATVMMGANGAPQGMPQGNGPQGYGQAGAPQGAPQWTPQWGPPGYQNRPMTRQPEYPRDDFGTDETTRLTAADMPENQKQNFEKEVGASNLGTDETTRLTAADMPDNQKQDFEKATNASALGMDETARLTSADMPAHLGGRQDARKAPGGFSHVAGSAGNAQTDYHQEDMTARGRVLTSQPVDTGIGGPALTAQPGQPPKFAAQGNQPQASAKKKQGGKGLGILFIILSILGAAGIAVFLLLGLKEKNKKKDIEAKQEIVEAKLDDIETAEKICNAAYSTLANEDAFNNAHKNGYYQDTEEGIIAVYLENGSKSAKKSSQMEGSEYADELSKVLASSDFDTEIEYQPEGKEGWKWYIGWKDYEIYVYIGTGDQPAKYQLYPGISTEYRESK